MHNINNTYPAIGDPDVSIAARQILKENTLSSDSKIKPGYKNNSVKEIFESYGMRAINFSDLANNVQQKIMDSARGLPSLHGFPRKVLRDANITWPELFKVMISQDGQRIYFYHDQNNDITNPYGRIAWSHFQNGKFTTVNHDSNKGELYRQLAKTEAQGQVAKQRGLVVDTLMDV